MVEFVQVFRDIAVNRDNVIVTTVQPDNAEAQMRSILAGTDLVTDPDVTSSRMFVK